jgi:hypothetical protein
MGRLDLGRHGWPLQRFRGGFKSASFLLQSKMKLEATAIVPRLPFLTAFDFGGGFHFASRKCVKTRK